MSDVKMFLHWTYSFETLQERCRIIEDLLRYVAKGVDNQYDPSARHESWHEFDADVRSRMYEAFRPLVKPFRKNPKGFEGSTTEILFSAYDDALLSNKILATPHFSSDEISKAFEERFGSTTIPVYHEGEPSVRSAYELALKNFRQSEGRLYTAYALHTLTRTRDFGNIPDLNGFDKIRRTLWERSRRFLYEAALFGGLLGGKDAADVAMLLALESCHNETDGYTQYAVMQFLCADGISPGRWECAIEDRFRADIRAKFNALKEIK